MRILLQIDLWVSRRRRRRRRRSSSSSRSRDDDDHHGLHGDLRFSVDVCLKSPRSVL
jgi:hypothetical protein